MFNLQNYLKNFNENFTENLFPENPKELYEPCIYFLSIGGKRLRPALCILGNELFAEINPQIYKLASALELFHNFTLMHDDIMDGSPLRRNKSTVHIKYNQNTAILSGDVMLIKAYQCIENIDIQFLPSIFSLLNDTALKVCEGQQLDLNFEKRSTIISFNEYVQMIVLKTAVLIAASLEMGAILGKASLEDRHNLYQFGINIGIAFQIQDDYLDVFGSMDKFGKEIGNDIKNNKKTFLYIYVMENANDDTKIHFLDIMNSDNVDKIEKITSIYRQLGVDKWTRNLQEKYIKIALEYLDKIGISPEKKNNLLELTKMLLERTI